MNTTFVVCEMTIVWYFGNAEIAVPLHTDKQ